MRSPGKYFSPFLIFASMITTVGILWGMIFVYASEPPISYLDAPWQTKKELYKDNEAITFDLIRCADYPLEYSFTQEFVRLDDGVVFTLPSSEVVVIAPGCEEIKSVPKYAHPDMTTGRYFFRSDVTVQGKWREHTLRNLTTTPFTYEKTS